MHQSTKRLILSLLQQERDRIQLAIEEIKGGLFDSEDEKKPDNNPGLPIRSAPASDQASAPAATKKPHWTQTPAGRKRAREIAIARQAKNRKNR
jgi:hypothetical protein